MRVTLEQVCVYYSECHGKGIHQCPKCKKWYCDDCHELFLPIDNQNWVESNMMCAQCHYTTYEVPKFHQE